MDITEQLKQDVSEAVELVREKADKFGQDSAEAKEAMDAIQKTVDQFDEKNQKLVTDLKAAEANAEELKGRLDEVETMLARNSQNGKQDYKESPHYKAIQAFCKTGDEKVFAEIKEMRSDISTDGGYLVPMEMERELIKKITEISPIRSLARVMTVGRKSIEIPKRDSILSATYEGEAGSSSDSESKYANETLTTHRLTVNVPFTEDLMMDAAFDLEAQINQDVSESFAQREGNRFVLGSGVKQPEGFLSKASLIAAAAETAVSGVLDADALLSLPGELKTGYNPVYGFNRKTLAAVRLLKDSQNRYLWQMGLAPADPSTIAGDPYVEIPDMPDIASGALSVIYADFFRGYRIVDRTGLVVTRDPYTRKKEAIIELNFRRWNHGQVVLDEAFQILKIKA